MEKRSRLAVVKLVLPLVGLSLLPLAGLVYAATTSFGPKTPAAASGSAVASARKGARQLDDLDDDAPIPPGPTGNMAMDLTPKAPRGPVPVVKPTFKGTGNSKAPDHALCCEKLSDMSQSASAKDKATLSAAIAACSSAASYEGAMNQVAGILDGTTIDIPNECKKR
jgi:hypothetical protein